MILNCWMAGAPRRPVSTLFFVRDMKYALVTWSMAMDVYAGYLGFATGNRTCSRADFINSKLRVVCVRPSGELIRKDIDIVGWGRVGVRRRSDDAKEGVLFEFV